MVAELSLSCGHLLFLCCTSIQKQQINSYQPADRLFCVAATYELEGRKQFFFTDAITVNNYGNVGAVNGPNTGGDLCATRPDASNEPGKLKVAPCFLPTFLAGPYWVAALDEDNYEWAIVVGGQTSIEAENDATLCSTAEDAGFLNLNGNNEGLWFLTRDQVANATMLADMEGAAVAAGIDTSRMLEVQQEGCLYDGAFIKS